MRQVGEGDDEVAAQAGMADARMRHADVQDLAAQRMRVDAIDRQRRRLGSMAVAVAPLLADWVGRRGWRHGGTGGRGEVLQDRQRVPACPRRRALQAQTARYGKA